MNPEPTRILLVEDSPSDAALLQESLAQDGLGPFTFAHAESWAQTLEELQQQPYDVLLLDLSLPDSHGRETFLRARAAAPRLPIVVLTGVQDETVGLDAVQHGIQDYLIKGQTDGRQTARAIRYAIERKRAETTIGRLASFPEMTPSPVAEIDLAGKVHYVNPAARNLFPDLDEMGLQHPWLAGFERLIALFQGGQSGAMVREVTAGKRWYQQAVNYVEDAARVRIYGLDITEAKQAQMELLQAHADLELQVKKRTADLERTVAALQTEIGYRQVAERAMRESEERYRRLFESAPVGIAISNRQGNVLAFNQRLCEMGRLTLKEALATPAAAFFADPGQRRRLIAELRKRGTVSEREVLLKRKDGATFLGLLGMTEVQSGAKKVITTIVQDITRQREAERHIEGVAALLKLFPTRSSRSQYLKAVARLLREWCDCRCAGVRLLDTDGRLPYAAQVGFSARFLKQESCVSVDTRDCACLRVLRGEARPEDLPWASAHGSFYRNGHHVHAGPLGTVPATCAALACTVAGYRSVAQTPIRYEDKIIGTIHLADRRPNRLTKETISFVEAAAGLVGIAIRRFQEEEALQESEERFRSMFEGNEAVMLLAEPESRTIVDANPAAAAFYGYPRDRLRQMKMEKLGLTCDATAESGRRRPRAGERTVQVSLHRLASGEGRAVEVHASTVPVRGRRLLFSIIHDVTERKRLEKEVLDVGERERQHLGQDLHDSLGGKLAGAALMSKALSQTLSGKLPHEAALAEEIVGCINESIAQARSIARGLCQVDLTVSGLAGGLAEFAAETQRRFGVSCRFHADKRLQIHDVSVATHLFRIVQEAVTNATRHGGARQVRISLTRAGKHIALEVRDDGAGLPSNLAASKGLGLRTMRHRAELIGAHLTVKSADGGGTLVCCLFPANNANRNRRK